MRWKVISNTGKQAVLEGDGLQIQMDRPTDVVLRRVFLGFRAGTILDEGIIESFGVLANPDASMAMMRTQLSIQRNVNQVSHSRL